MTTHSFPWLGFIIGVLFGVLGMWLLALLSLALQPVELLTGPLFAFGRYVATFVEQDGSVGTAGTVLLFGVNGLFYGVIGAIIQLAGRHVRKA